LTAEVLSIHPTKPEPDRIARVVQSIAAGNVAALPTDTFYGLAVDPVNLRAVERIYEIKTRARHKPLSLLISETAQAYGLARQLDTAFDRLAERFWPGPLTIIVKAGARLPLRVTANTGNVALRVPEAAIARAVVDSLGLPITATSANLRGMPECTDAHFVRAQLAPHHHRRPLRRRQLLDDPPRRRHPHPRNRPHPPALANTLVPAAKN
jgi:tRNA threonylcarbamoyl adenosine modification protein (Sua5/YciO/YrdC/YwlC family)